MRFCRLWTLGTLLWKPVRTGELGVCTRPATPPPQGPSSQTRGPRIRGKRGCEQLGLRCCGACVEPARWNTAPGLSQRLPGRQPWSSAESRAAVPRCLGLEQWLLVVQWFHMS